MRPYAVSVLFLFSAVALAGCDLIAGIFKAGILVGIVAVAAVIAIVVWLFYQNALLRQL